ncbi:hypothetical protein ACFLQ0_02525 [Nitrospinota bacterium]
MDTALFIAKELINFNAADFLLIGLVVIFFFSGLGYKIKATKEVSRLRGEVETMKGSVEGIANKEKALRDELHNLLNSQSVNMSEINRLKAKKMEMGKMPINLSKELEDLVAWCQKEKISVSFERRMAAKRPTPKGRRM